MAEKRKIESLSDSDDESAPDFKRSSFATSTGRHENESEQDQGMLANSDSVDGTNSFTGYSDYSLKLMGKMGFQVGEGLGKFGQGRSEIVEASKQRGRRGLGFEIEGLEADDVEWTETEKEVEVVETANWIPSCELEPPTRNDMNDWMTISKRKSSIKDETEFCNEKILHGVLACKTVFDSLAENEFLKARTRANPYEMVKGAIFQNRAAMKMANMDAVFDFMFSCPRDKDNRELLGSMDLLYFADICAGPGGFSEYMLWRKSWHCKGFGFTLRGENDFKLDKFLSGTPETFEPFYGVNGIDGDGDIMNPDNLMAFKDFVLNNTDGLGVHFVMGDGGFSVAGQENFQEVLTKRLVLCQFLCAMSVLRKGGYFLCKTFDLFTPFSIGLVYLLYRAFDHVCLHKPVTSRPANSERYVICKGLRENTEEICSYLFFINEELGRLERTNSDILEVVPLDMLKNDQTFYSYVRNSNESLGENQINALKKLRAYVQNVTLVGKDQGLIRRQCLEYWKIPDIARSQPRVSNPDIHFQDLLKTAKDRDELICKPKIFTKQHLNELKVLGKFKCYVSSGERFFLLGLGRSRLFQWDGTPRGRKQWRGLDQMNLELPKDTLIEVEKVEELRGEGKGQRRSVVIHITDALILGGKDIRTRHYAHRMEYAAMFAKAITKQSRPDMVIVRAKPIYSLDVLGDIFDRLEIRRVKGRPPALCFVTDDDRAIIPTGIAFIKHLNDPWSTAFSKSQQKTYFYNSETRSSQFDIPLQAIATFGMCAQNRYFWNWGELREDLDTNDRDLVSKQVMLDFIRSHSIR
ncbi:cap-specific mRNA (nucleoside-2'-O-)-methyltransferase 1-like [Dendronephthya gigantea]|uniref:cap-specific mRNA (nucleoside-2'-O-)-methyltransferase 1-like n=1 Tax=Dendronephthya gigantea TaxID=151771 RepID=UPI001069DDA2|nr:cap-specific mRNA (nucleoside-2'-O-)-methyltransferase 1-like [Dendronephthya gigantea]XP_028408923.1 cap-specific mRNA (nucleoside-2'-O-)-methyltransferase 1-like [Dendronephthya gigantea]XP_028408925.1 cap-specific mRNA (nucleoside-2'-O-)-methyltransferase 1-like [Dendronephthya gigantea]XP_028408926.1 cap-specific mRNA (nucleoside-2'-O-)-methyltransferase 1-like [Dendronephthya gigantea]